MTTSKYNKIKKAAKAGHYHDTFCTCLNMIPEGVQNSLPWHQLAQLVDTIHESYENGHTAGWKEAQ